MYGCEKWSPTSIDEHKLQVRFDVLTAVKMSLLVFWAVTTYRWIPTPSEKHNVFLQG
jgi:hypothetical protein